MKLAGGPVVSLIYVQDGEDVSFIAELGPSVFDPANQYPGVTRAFRVIANNSSEGPILDLAPISYARTLSQELMYRRK